MKVLVIDDDLSIHALVKKFINPLISLDLLADLPDPKKLGNYDLIILDFWLSNDKNSLEYLNTLSLKSPEVLDRIILLTGSGSEDVEVEVHKLGVRDFIKKPFNPRVFSAVIDKHLMHLKKTNVDLRYGPIRLDMANFEAYVDGVSEKLDLTTTEFKILRLMVESKGRVVTRDRLITDVWDMNEDTTTRTIDMHISTLRKKLGPGSDFLKTKRGLGYYLSTEK